MNRRTLLQSLGAALGVLSTPLRGTAQGEVCDACEDGPRGCEAPGASTSEP